MSKKSKLGIVVADPHCGSYWGLSPLSVELPGTNDGEYRVGKLGRLLYNEYMKLVKEFYKPDFLLFLGDSIEGKQKKSGGEGTWTTNFQVQGAVAIDLLNEWKAKSFYAVRGTRYHIDDANADEYVAKNVSNAIAIDGQYAPPDRYLTVLGHIIHMAHKIGGSHVFQSRATAPARELTQNRIMDPKSDVYRANLILRGHLHHYARLDLGVHCSMIKCPGFKLRDDYSAMENPFAWIPQQGIIVIEATAKEMNYIPRLVEITQRPTLETV